MARKKRIWIPDCFYHIVARGNRRDALFKDKSDFKVFLDILRCVNQQTPFTLVSYCLMTNHYHLQLRSRKQHVSKVMSLINKRYADYYNTKYRITGHVFEKRYYDTIINTKQGMLEVSRYIHLNPFDAKMVEYPEAYRWSSYQYYVQTIAHHQLKVDVILDYFPGDAIQRREGYRTFVEDPRDES